MKIAMTCITLAALAAAPAWAQSDQGPRESEPSHAPPPHGATLPLPPTQPEELQEVVEQTAPSAGHSPEGQWSYTAQYGWIWTPYAQNYTYVAEKGETAFTYAYYPRYGWRWLPAPWVLGWGPRPYWGHYGYNRFAWHERPWFRVGVYRPEVWTHWGHGYGHGYAYGHERVIVRPPYGVGHGHGGGWRHR